MLKKGALALVLGLLAFGMMEVYIYARVKADVKAKLQKELIKIQNEAIAKKALESKDYINKMPAAQEKIVTKYKIITTTDTSCEAKLKEFKNALDLYFNTTSSLKP